MENNNSNSGGISFAGLLTIVFICLKLMGFIAWSWWWVLSPLWINVGIVIITLLAFLVSDIIAKIITANRK